MKNTFHIRKPCSVVFDWAKGAHICCRHICRSSFAIVSNQTLLELRYSVNLCLTIVAAVAVAVALVVVVGLGGGLGGGGLGGGHQTEVTDLGPRAHRPADPGVYQPVPGTAAPAALGSKRVASTVRVLIFHGVCKPRIQSVIYS